MPGRLAPARAAGKLCPASSAAPSRRTRARRRAADRHSDRDGHVTPRRRRAPSGSPGELFSGRHVGSATVTVPRRPQTLTAAEARREI